MEGSPLRLSMKNRVKTKASPPSRTPEQAAAERTKDWEKVKVPLSNHLYSEFNLLRQTLFLGRIKCSSLEARVWAGVVVISLLVLAARLFRFAFLDGRSLGEGE